MDQRLPHTTRHRRSRPHSDTNRHATAFLPICSSDGMSGYGTFDYARPSMNGTLVVGTYLIRSHAPERGGDQIIYCCLPLAENMRPVRSTLALDDHNLIRAISSSLFAEFGRLMSSEHRSRLLSHLMMSLLII
jgi:hypothetical protein